jgi:HAD superfamily hydrolase (TIGR01509 family)
MITAILFDLDGTLIDSNASHDFAFRKTLLDMNLKLSEIFFYNSIKGMSTRDAFTKLLPYADENVINSCIRYKQDIYIQSINDRQINVYSGGEELLQCLKKFNIKTYLVTGSSKRSVESIINTYNLKFDGIICATDFLKGKPDPEPYSTCLRHFNLKISESIAIEDSISGINSGLSAGLKTFGVHNSSIKNLCTLWFPDLIELHSYFQTTLRFL